VATHPSLDATLIELLIADESATVRRRILRTCALPFSVLSRLLLASQLSDRLHIQLVAKLDDEMTTEELAALNHPIARYTALRFGRLTSKTAHVIVAEQPWLANWLVLNERAPLAALKTLAVKNAKHPIAVRRGAALQIAQRTSATFWLLYREPPEVLAARLSQPNCARRVRVASHLRRRSPAVGRGLAARPDLSLWSRQALTRHSSWDVRAVLAARQDISSSNFRRLCTSTDWAVLDALAANHALASKQIQRIPVRHEAITLTQVQHPDCPVTILQNAISAWSADPHVRAVALRHPALDTATLRSAAEDLRAPAWVLSSIARNPSCPPDVRDGLLAWITVGGAGHTDPMFDPATGVGHPGDTRTDRNAAVNSYAGPRARVAIFRLAWARAQKNLGPSALKLLARDPDPAIRQRAAQFTNRAMLRTLTDDADAKVVQQASGLLPTVPKQKWRPRDITTRSLQPLLIGLVIVVAIAAGSHDITNSLQPSTPAFTLPRTGMDAPLPTAVELAPQRLVQIQTLDTTVICSKPAIRVELVSAGKTRMMVRVLNTTDIPVAISNAAFTATLMATPKAPVLTSVELIDGHGYIKASRPDALSTISFDVDPSALTLKGTCS
jgi:hypothetical protein